MPRRLQRSRCYICKIVLSRTGWALRQFSFTQGWHIEYPLCRPCYSALADIIMVVEEEYR
jgi:hypothetical protein